MCGSMADIQSAVAEIWRRKQKIERTNDRATTLGLKYAF